MKVRTDLLDALREHDRESFERQTEAWIDAFEPWALFAMDRFLSGMAIDAAYGAGGAVKMPVIGARKNGATNEETIEVMKNVNFICGIGSIRPASNGLGDVFLSVL